MIEIYSTDTDSGQLTVLRKDGDSYSTAAAIRVGNAPRGSVKFTADGRGFVSNTSTNTVSEIDAVTHEEVGRIIVGSGPRGLHIVPGDRYLLVSNSGSDTLSIVDLKRREEVRQIPIGRDPRHMAVIADAAYVCLWGDGALAKLDITSLESGDVNGVVQTGTIMLGPDTFPYSVNVDRKRMTALVACNAIQSVPVIDLATDSLIADVEIRAGGARAIAFSSDEDYAFVTLERDSSIAVVDLDQNRVSRYIQVGPGPRGVTVDPDGVVYAAAFSRPIVTMFPVENYASHSVTVIDPTRADLSRDGDDVTVTSVGVGFGPCSVSVFDPAKAELVRSKTSNSTIAVDA
ncbi:YVTN family beta-propeller repeat protein [Leifsonia sp. 2MCAF36]|uniref:YVTN family beta-propeller repeat protein n=1 Tax=Leifsonia sp. 2MCAF36 TaxID=3232988 RepID=UPI003F95C04B